MRTFFTAAARMILSSWRRGSSCERSPRPIPNQALRGCVQRAELGSTCHRQMREERLGGPALAAEKMKRVAALPWIGGVADRAERLLRRKWPLAMIASHRVAGGIHVILAAHFTTHR